MSNNYYSSFGSDDSGSSAYVYRRWCGVRRSSWLLLIYIITYVGYLVAGGWMMALVEEGEQQRLKAEVREAKISFLLKYKDVNSTDLEELLEQCTKYRLSGISVLDKYQDEDSWSFGQSILFTVTVVTTIGYGHVYPLTPLGKVFCICYSILGIPFTLVFLSATVQRLLEPTCRVLAFLFARLSPQLPPLSIRLIHLGFMSLLFLVLFLLLPSAVFFLLEPDWSFLDGFYFVFVSLTTIGLGDYIPGDDPDAHTGLFREVYKTAVAVYLLLGLMFMTLTATVFYDIPQLNLSTALHQQQDIHLGGNSSSENSSLKEAVRRFKLRVKRRKEKNIIQAEATEEEENEANK